MHKAIYWGSMLPKYYCDKINVLCTSRWIGWWEGWVPDIVVTARGFDGVDDEMRTLYTCDTHTDNIHSIIIDIYCQSWIYRYVYIILLIGCFHSLPVLWRLWFFDIYGLINKLHKQLCNLGETLLRQKQIYVTVFLSCLKLITNHLLYW